jgi:hypothetical protein
MLSTTLLPLRTSKPCVNVPCTVLNLSSRCSARLSAETACIGYQSRLCSVAGATPPPPCGDLYTIIPLNLMLFIPSALCLRRSATNRPLQKDLEMPRRRINVQRSKSASLLWHTLINKTVVYTYSSLHEKRQQQTRCYTSRTTSLDDLAC